MCYEALKAVVKDTGENIFPRLMGKENYSGFFFHNIDAKKIAVVGGKNLTIFERFGCHSKRWGHKNPPRSG
jgi:hypothetical protein